LVSVLSYRHNCDSRLHAVIYYFIYKSIRTDCDSSPEDTGNGSLEFVSTVINRCGKFRYYRAVRKVTLRNPNTVKTGDRCALWVLSIV